LIEAAFLIVILASWVYWVMAWCLVRAFFRTRQPARCEFTPPVSILKPVKGIDAEAYRNFVSFCQQDYPDFELLFGVIDPEDPVIPVIKRLQREFARLSIRLIIAPVTSANRKAGILHRLAAEARHEMLAASDSDMRVPPDYLKRVIAPLADEQFGLVTCPYRGEMPLNLTACLETLHMGVTFLPSVLVARKLQGMRFAMGSTVALRRENLERLGGFAAIENYLADDYQLGRRMAGLGLEVYLSDYIVVSVLGRTTFAAQWNREVRWARCIRISKPREYPGLLLTFSTPLAVFCALMTGFDAIAQGLLITSLLLRWLVGWFITAYTHDHAARRLLLWLPVRDLLSFLVWCAGAVGKRIVWRDEEFVLQHDGRLKPAVASGGNSGRAFSSVPIKIIRVVDVLLRRHYRIFEFSQNEECLLRLSVIKNERDVILADGTTVCRGDVIGELHLWNEHVPPVPGEGPSLAWALSFQRRMIRSLRELAACIQAEPRLREIKAFRGENSFGGRQGQLQATDLIKRWGFELVPKAQPIGIRQGFADFFQRLYMLGLVWAFKSYKVNRSLKEMMQGRLWVSRRKLITDYGGTGKPRPSGDSRLVPGPSVTGSR
jgi:ceramide glucosyltransferase